MRIIQEEFVRSCGRKILELEDELATLKERLCNIENSEPDDRESEQYERWEEKCLWLKEQIFNTEAEMSELENVIELELRP